MDESFEEEETEQTASASHFNEEERSDAVDYDHGDDGPGSSHYSEAFGEVSQLSPSRDIPDDEIHCANCSNYRDNTIRAFEAATNVSKLQAQYNKMSNKYEELCKNNASASMLVENTYSKLRDTEIHRDTLKGDLSMALSEIQRLQELNKQYLDAARLTDKHRQAADSWRNKYIQSQTILLDKAQKYDALEEKYRNSVDLVKTTLGTSNDNAKKLLTLQDKFNQKIVDSRVMKNTWNPVVRLIADIANQFSDQLPNDIRERLNKLRMDELLQIAKPTARGGDDSDDDAAERVERLMDADAEDSHAEIPGFSSKSRGASSGRGNRGSGGVRVQSTICKRRGRHIVDESMHENLLSRKLHKSDLEQTMATSHPAAMSVMGKKTETVREQQERQKAGLKDKIAELKKNAAANSDQSKATVEPGPNLKDDMMLSDEDNDRNLPDEANEPSEDARPSIEYDLDMPDFGSASVEGSGGVDESLTFSDSSCEKQSTITGSLELPIQITVPIEPPSSVEASAKYEKAPTTPDALTDPSEQIIPVDPALPIDTPTPVQQVLSVDVTAVATIADLTPLKDEKAHSCQDGVTMDENERSANESAKATDSSSSANAPGAVEDVLSTDGNLADKSPSPSKMIQHPKVLELSQERAEVDALRCVNPLKQEQRRQESLVALGMDMSDSDESGDEDEKTENAERIKKSMRTPFKSPPKTSQKSPLAMEKHKHTAEMAPPFSMTNTRGELGLSRRINKADTVHVARSNNLVVPIEQISSTQSAGASLLDDILSGAHKSKTVTNRKTLEIKKASVGKEKEVSETEETVREPSAMEEVDEATRPELRRSSRTRSHVLPSAHTSSLSLTPKTPQKIKCESIHEGSNSSEEKKKSVKRRVSVSSIEENVEETEESEALLNNRNRRISTSTKKQTNPPEKESKPDMVINPVCKRTRSKSIGRDEVKETAARLREEAITAPTASTSLSLIRSRKLPSENAPDDAVPFSRNSRRTAVAAPRVRSTAAPPAAAPLVLPSLSLDAKSSLDGISKSLSTSRKRIARMFSDVDNNGEMQIDEDADRTPQLQNEKEPSPALRLDSDHEPGDLIIDSGSNSPAPSPIPPMSPTMPAPSIAPLALSIPPTQSLEEKRRNAIMALNANRERPNTKGGIGGVSARGGRQPAGSISTRPTSSGNGSRTSAMEARMAKMSKNLHSGKLAMSGRSRPLQSSTACGSSADVASSRQLPTLPTQQQPPESSVKAAAIAVTRGNVIPQKKINDPRHLKRKANAMSSVDAVAIRSSNSRMKGQSAAVPAVVSAIGTGISAESRLITTVLNVCRDEESVEKAMQQMDTSMLRVDTIVKCFCMAIMELPQSNTWHVVLANMKKEIEAVDRNKVIPKAERNLFDLLMNMHGNGDSMMLALFEKFYETYCRTVLRSISSSNTTADVTRNVRCLFFALVLTERSEDEKVEEGRKLFHQILQNKSSQAVCQSLVYLLYQKDTSSLVSDILRTELNDDVNGGRLISIHVNAKDAEVLYWAVEKFANNSCKNLSTAAFRTPATLEMVQRWWDTDMSAVEKVKDQPDSVSYTSSGVLKVNTMYKELMVRMPVLISPQLKVDGLDRVKLLEQLDTPALDAVDRVTASRIQDTGQVSMFTDTSSVSRSYLEAAEARVVVLKIHIAMAALTSFYTYRMFEADQREALRLHLANSIERVRSILRRPAADLSSQVTIPENYLYMGLRAVMKWRDVVQRLTQNDLMYYPDIRSAESTPVKKRQRCDDVADQSTC